MNQGYDVGPWTIPIPVVAAILGASAALLFALLKSALDRRQALIDMVRLLQAELDNAIRHTQDSWYTLPSSCDSTLVKAQVEMTRFPASGLVTLQIKDLIGLPSLLITDLMTLILYLRNFNFLADEIKEGSGSPAFVAQLDVLRARLMISQKWAKAINAGMKQNWFTGKVGYPKESQAPTTSLKRAAAMREPAAT